MAKPFWLLSRILRARAEQRADHAALVAFVAGILEHGPVDLRHRHHRSPRPRPRRGILDGELIVDRAVAHAREALHEVQAFADPRNAAFSLKLTVSTTSVWPSQCPRESPIHDRVVPCGRPSIGTIRASWIISLTMTM